MTNLQKKLFQMQDKAYKEFIQKLMPTVPHEKVIGIRTPHLRSFAKEFFKTQNFQKFLSNLPHKYFEEDNLHTFVIEQIKDYETAIQETEKFLPFIDNWATCDMFLPKVFKKHKEELLPKIYEWIKSKNTYTVRYAIGILMKLYLDEDYKSEYLKLVASVKSDKYYTNMMKAWYFSTALSKQYSEAVLYLQNNVLDKWTHNKTIQKAIESNRIPPKTKEYLKSLRKKD